MKKIMSISLLALLLVACSSPTNEATKVQSTMGEEKENEQKTSEPSEEVNEKEATTPKQEELPKEEQQPSAILSTKEQMKRLKEARQTAEQAYAAVQTSNDLTPYREIQFEHSTKVDAQLNDIYNILKQQLPKADFQALQQQQRQWLEDREAYAKKVAEPSAGTRGAGDLYNEGILEYTEQRTEIKCSNPRTERLNVGVRGLLIDRSLNR